MAVDQSEQHVATLRSYGGADNTAPSFNRPQYVRYNSLSKSLDLGRADNVDFILDGTIGAEVGAPTLFFEVEVLTDSRIGLIKQPINRFVDATISASIQDERGKPLSLKPDGFAYIDRGYGVSDDLDTILPAGRYRFVVSSSRWQAQPFELFITVISYRAPVGQAGGTIELVGRLAMSKLYGDILGTMVPEIVPALRFKALTGAAGGLIDLVGQFAGLSGSAGGTLELSGRFKVFWKIAGTAGGNGDLVGTLSIKGAYGGY